MRALGGGGQNHCRSGRQAHTSVSPGQQIREFNSADPSDEQAMEDA
jgi:hypothetical protein